MIIVTSTLSVFREVLEHLTPEAVIGHESVKEATNDPEIKGARRADLHWIIADTDSIRLADALITKNKVGSVVVIDPPTEPTHARSLRYPVSARALATHLMSAGIEVTCSDCDHYRPIGTTGFENEEPAGFDFDDDDFEFDEAPPIPVIEPASVPVLAPAPTWNEQVQSQPPMMATVEPKPAPAFVAPAAPEWSDDSIPVLAPAPTWNEQVQSQPPMMATVEPKPAPAFVAPAAPEWSDETSKKEASPLCIVVAVMSAKGGVGKSTTAVNLAAWIASRFGDEGRGRRVALIDANAHQADVMKRMDLPPAAKSIVDLPHDASLTRESITACLQTHPESPLWVLSGPVTSRDVDRGVSPALYLQIVKQMTEMFDIIVIDTPVAKPDEQFVEHFVRKITNKFVVIVEPDTATLDDNRKWLHIVTGSRVTRGWEVSKHDVAWVLNFGRSGDLMTVSAVEQVLIEFGPATAVFPYLERWGHATNNSTLAVQDPELHAALQTPFGQLDAAVTGDPLQQQTVVTPKRKRFWERKKKK